MRRFLALFGLLALAGLAGARPATAQGAAFPDTPQGRLAEAFFAAVNAPDEMTLARFQDASFSDAALKRRPTEERLARNRQLREGGRLALVSVVSASGNRLVVTATASNMPGVSLRVEFGFTGGGTPKIDTLQITG